MMKKLVGILFVLISVGAFAQTEKEAKDSTRIFMYCGNQYPQNKPLIIVNSKPYRDSLSHIDPNNIERIDVLKDSVAVAKYGEAGKNGVILITTKKRKKN